MCRRQLEPSQSFTANMPAKLISSKLRRQPADKDWDDQCCQPHLFSYRNSIPGSIGGHVAGASAAYESQPCVFSALQDSGGYAISRHSNLELPLGCHI